MRTSFGEFSNADREYQLRDRIDQRSRRCASIILICLAFTVIGAFAQNSTPVSVDRLPLAECCRLPEKLGDVQPVPPATVASLRHRLSHHGRYDVSRIGSRKIGDGVNLYSLERDIELGRQMAAETDSQARFLRDQLVTDYVNRIAQNLVAHSDAKVPFTIKVVDSDEVNAFSLPGGYLYVNRGLLMAVENEAELASVISHEIAHVAARHATKAMTRKQLFTLATLPLMFVGGGAASAVSQVAGFAQPISALKFSRNDEREADLLGLEYVYAAGYDPTEFVHFFEKMRKTTGEKKSSFVVRIFQTHPVTEDRIRRAQEEIATMLPAKEHYLVTTSEFEEVRNHIVQLRASQEAAEKPTLRRRTPQQTGSQ